MSGNPRNTAHEATVVMSGGWVLRVRGSFGSLGPGAALSFGSSSSAPSAQSDLRDLFPSAPSYLVPVTLELVYAQIDSTDASLSPRIRKGGGGGGVPDLQMMLQFDF